MRPRGKLTSLRVGGVLADVILFMQAVGVLGGILWKNNFGETDWFGFAYFVGAAAGLIAYFGFFLFAFFYLPKHPLDFWRSLFPVNLGLAIFLFTLPVLSYTNGLYPGALLVGVLLALFGVGVIRAHPRLSLLFVITLIYGGALFYRLAPYDVREWLRAAGTAYPFIALGGFLLTAPLFLQYQRLTAKTPTPAADAVPPPA